MSVTLPPPNPNAHSLHLTDLEFAGIMAFVQSQPILGKAMIFGSRRSGRRREKEGQGEPPDIDLAVEFLGVPDDELLLAAFSIRKAACEFFVHDNPHYGLTTKKNQPGCVQIEFPVSEGSTVAGFILKEGATLIFERE